MSLWLAHRPLVLASKSASRRFLLESAGIPIEISAADIDERGVEANAGLADPGAVAEEVALSRKLCAKHNWPSIDVTRRSIEETAAAVLSLLADRRRQPVA